MKRKFIIKKTFSMITNEDDFRKYAHKVMKNAHGDNYSEEETDKVVDDLIKNNPNADYGELIGRLTSGLGEKSFSALEQYNKYKKLFKEQEEKSDPSNPVDRARSKWRQAMLNLYKVKSDKEAYEEKIKVDMEKFQSMIEKYDEIISSANRDIEKAMREANRR